MEGKITRREARNTAFILVFESLFREDSQDELIQLVHESNSLGENIPYSTDVEKMFRGTMRHVEHLDEIIARYSEKRNLDRISKVNVAILRLALFEILYDEKVPMSVAINEAVLLSKKYALDPDVAFVNGVLGSFSRSSEAPEENDKSTEPEMDIPDSRSSYPTTQN